MAQLEGAGRRVSRGWEAPSAVSQMWQSRTSSAGMISRTFKFARQALSSVLVLQDELSD
jgi:hypothetical protein